MYQYTFLLHHPIHHYTDRCKLSHFSAWFFPSKKKKKSISTKIERDTVTKADRQTVINFSLWNLCDALRKTDNFSRCTFFAIFMFHTFKLIACWNTLLYIQIDKGKLKFSKSQLKKSNFSQLTKWYNINWLKIYLLVTALFLCTVTGSLCTHAMHGFN